MFASGGIRVTRRPGHVAAAQYVMPKHADSLKRRLPPVDTLNDIQVDLYGTQDADLGGAWIRIPRPDPDFDLILLLLYMTICTRRSYAGGTWLR